MRTVTLARENATVYLEHESGGVTICMLVQEADGAYVSHRSWYGSAVQGRAVDAALTAATIEPLIAARRTTEGR